MVSRVYYLDLHSEEFFGSTESGRGVRPPFLRLLLSFRFVLFADILLLAYSHLVFWSLFLQLWTTTSFCIFFSTLFGEWTECLSKSGGEMCQMLVFLLKDPHPMFVTFGSRSCFRELLCDACSSMGWHVVSEVLNRFCAMRKQQLSLPQRPPFLVSPWLSQRAWICLEGQLPGSFSKRVFFVLGAT